MSGEAVATLRPARRAELQDRAERAETEAARLRLAMESAHAMAAQMQANAPAPSAEHDGFSYLRSLLARALSEAK